MKSHGPAFSRILYGLIAALLLLVMADQATAQQECRRTITANVVALDQPFMVNRLGGANPGGMIYALKRDVVSSDTPINEYGQDVDPEKYLPLKPGNVRLRSDKRPRPIVLRMNVGDCLKVNFTNLLSESPQNTQSSNANTRYAGVHIMGLNLVGSIDSDASWVGRNSNSTAAPGETKTYTYFAPAEGCFLLHSAADPSGGQTGLGLFGSVNVQPEGAEWYRSQVTRTDLHDATYMVTGSYEVPDNKNMSIVPEKDAYGKPLTERADERELKRGTLKTFNPLRRTVQSAEIGVTNDGHLYSEDGHPLINYKATQEDGMPILSMLKTNAGALLFGAGLSDVPGAVEALNAGIISASLKRLFRTNNITLSNNATVTNEVEGSGWLITDQNRVYLVKVEGARLNVYPASLELIYTDLTAIITGPNAQRFPYSNNSPSFVENPATPDRRQPYREYTIIYHQPGSLQQAFPIYSNPNMQGVLKAGEDGFAINYGVGGIGSEILANRLGVGPMGNKDAVDLKYEEFFLASWAVGDPAMIVDKPANANSQVISNPAQGSKVITNPGDFVAPDPHKATKAFYPDDPSNVYHSYMRDHVKFRLLHAGTGPPHVHHLHAHQWLHSPNSDDGHYLDSQLITPGVAYTLEITYNGSGNRNLTVGDSIFHCHFYPHFAQGMWALWRVHDVFEAGTKLDEYGRPTAGADEYGSPIWNRALPDGEIHNGTPIPAIVPMPTLAMAPIPSNVRLTLNGRRAIVEPNGLEPNGTPTYKNPGFPFFIPGVAGHRAPHPPLDFAWKEDEHGQPVLENGEKQYLDGGLPRHLILNGEIVREFYTRWDFTKDFARYSTEDKLRQNESTFIAGSLTAFRLPENGTQVERAAMDAHATRTHPSIQPNGDPGNFVLNGLPPAPGAPYAAPDVNDYGDSVINTRRYKAAVIQNDVVLNKSGWHYPQQRFITLWGDIQDTTTGKRPPQPFFFRSNTGDSIEFWHTDLAPFYYELDDFQVRTPTDVIGQHIHLVKFDVTSSDGAGNGFNYEDGTLSPDEVRDRIHAVNAKGGLFAFNPRSQFIDWRSQEKLVVKPYRNWYPSTFGDPPAGQNWDGAQTTIQRWDSDPLLNDMGKDRTLRTVFTHDHFGPSTHQQVGLYAGLLVEPENSAWYLPSGERMNTRTDGGPTSWEGYIVTADPRESYREFAIEFQDMQLAYTNKSIPAVSSKMFNPAVTPDASSVFNTAQLGKGNQTAAYAAILNRGQVPSDFPSLFASVGIILLPNTTVRVVTPNKQWILMEPDFVKNGQTYPGTHYTVIANDPTSGRVGVPQSLSVYTPEIAEGWSDPPNALNPPSDSGNAGNPTGTGSGFGNGAPFPQLISFNSGNYGTYSMNYRNEPLQFRVGNPNNTPVTNTQAVDLSYVFKSDVTRLDPAYNSQPKPGTTISDGTSVDCRGTKPINKFIFPCTPLVPGMQPGDPFTPLMRAYVNDRVQVRTLVGAHLQTHSFLIHGVKWNFEPSYLNSGFRNAQGMGISEHFEMLFTVPPASAPHSGMPSFADYLYAGSSDTVGLSNGLWGIMRAYENQVGQVGQPDYLAPLPNNSKPDGTAVSSSVNFDFEKLYNDAKAAGRPTREFSVTATTAIQSLPNGQLVYNSRGNQAETADPNALIYVQSSDLDPNTGVVKAGINIEPLILRAAAGEWIKINLRNAFNPTGSTTQQPFQQRTDLGIGTPFSNNPYAPVPLNTSSRAGLNPQLLAYNITQANGVNVGFNPEQTAGPGETKTIYLYAGDLSIKEGCVPSAADDCIVQTPVEFGATGLAPSDLAVQHQKGLYGALIVEPKGSTWVEDKTASGDLTRASATVTKEDKSTFRDFVVVIQNDIENQQGNNPSITLAGSTAFNYRFEPFSLREIAAPSTTPAAPLGFARVFSNSLLMPFISSIPSSKVAAYAAILNRGQVPSDFTGLFADAGVTLNNATVQVIKANEEWVLNNPNGNNAGNDPNYPIKATRTQMSIFTTGDPRTPIFTATAGTPVRFRLVFPGGSTNNTPNQPVVVYVHGHGWQEEPYTHDSTVIGDNTLSQWFGSEQMAIYQTFNFLIPSAGGPSKVTGDYLYGGYQQEQIGIWGLLRVNKATVAIGEAVVTGRDSQTLLVKGTWTGAKAPTVRITSSDGKVRGDAVVNADGTWSFQISNVTLAPDAIVTATSSDGAISAMKVLVPNNP